MNNVALLWIALVAVLSVYTLGDAWGEQIEFGGVQPDFGDALNSYLGESGWYTNVTNAQSEVVGPGTLSDLMVTVDFSLVPGMLPLIIVQVNGEDTALRCPISQDGSSCANQQDTVRINDGDLISIRVVNLHSLTAGSTIMVAVNLDMEEATRGWEVWLSDQSDSYDISAENPTGTYGSRIVIYESSDILAAPPGTYYEDHAEFQPTVIEAADLFPNAKDELGVNVQRLHGMLPHPSHKYMNANFFGPGVGLIGIIDAEPECTHSEECVQIQAKALFRTTGPEGSQPSNHMSYWTPDGSKMIIANLGAKLLERIDYDPTTDTFAFNKAATLDLIGGRDLTALEAMADSTLPAGMVTGNYSNMQPTTTPSGALKEESGVRSNNVVVCPIPSSNSKHAYVTFGGGGLFVVDTDTEPMSIVAEYTNDVISVAGCGGVTDGEFMYLNAGVSASGAGADDSTFIMYRLPLDYPKGPVTSITPNYPPVVKFYEEKILDILPENEMQLAERRDAHGLVISPPNVFQSRYLYQFDRIQNDVEVFDTAKIINDPSATLAEQQIAHVGTLYLTQSGLCVGEDAPFTNHDGETYVDRDDPAPDLVDVSPDGQQLIVSFRGPHPVTVKHAGLGSCPGFGVVSLSEDGTAGELTHVFRTFVPDATGTKNLSDIHAVAVRVVN